MNKALALIVVSWMSGCGTLAQTIAGFSEEEVSTSSVTHVVSIATLPPGVAIARQDEGGERDLGLSPVTDRIAYQTEVVREVPRVDWFWAGLALDAAASAATAALIANVDVSDPDRRLLWLFWGSDVLGTFVAELIVGVILATRDPQLKGVRPRGGGVIANYRIKTGRPEDLSLTLRVPWIGKEVLVPVHPGAVTRSENVTVAPLPMVPDPNPNR